MWIPIRHLITYFYQDAKMKRKVMNESANNIQKNIFSFKTIDILEYIDCLMACTACLVCFISTVNGHCNKKRKEKKKITLGRLALVAATQQTLSNLFWDFRYLCLRPIYTFNKKRCDCSVRCNFKFEFWGETTLNIIAKCNTDLK